MTTFDPRHHAAASPPPGEDLGRLLDLALAEDIHTGDVTSQATLSPTAEGRAQAVAKAPGRLAGIAVAGEVFKKVDTRIRFSGHRADGEAIQPGDVLFDVAGPMISLLSAERLVLNILQRMSGIATQTARLAALLEGTRCQVLDTRKTAPNFRLLEKMAVRIGGGVNHRFGLYDMILIKDNHIDFAGGPAEALRRAKAFRERHPRPLPIEIETRSLAEVRAALAEGGADRILLDNMAPDTLRDAVAEIGGRAETEASGGITAENIRSVAETGVDYASVGALTHSYQSLDISLVAR